MKVVSMICIVFLKYFGKPLPLHEFSNLALVISVHTSLTYMGIPELCKAKSEGCLITSSIKPYTFASCADIKKSRSVSSII